MNLQTMVGDLSGLSRAGHGSLYVYSRGRNVVGLSSYRGFYDHLSLTLSKRTPVTVDALLTEAREALAGKKYTGYKGGDYTMYDHTPVWAAEYGDADSHAVGSFELDGSGVVASTVDISDYAGW